MADKKTLTLEELYNMIDEEDALTRRFSLFIEDDGTSEKNENLVWLSSAIGSAFKDWIVTKIGFRAGTFRIFIRKPERSQ